MNFENQNLTPMIRQYMEIKESHKDAILFFRLGDFYEMFFEDAVTASRVLDIALTSRNKNEDKSVPLCGVPYHAAQGYISKLTREGYKVAICDQVEDPKLAKGIVKREVTRIVTPGLVLDLETLESRKNNYLTSLAREGSRYGLSFLDISTGDFQVGEWGTFEEVLDEILKLETREILVPESFKNFPELELLEAHVSELRVVFLSDWVFEHRYAYSLLTGHFKVAHLEGFGCEDLHPGIGASGAILHYVRETQKTTNLPHMTRLKRCERFQYLYLGEETRRNLELEYSLGQDSKKGTLISVLDKTETAMGARRLRQWLRQPLLNIDAINARLDAIEEILKEKSWTQALHLLLRQISDLERINSRVSLSLASPRDLGALRDSLTLFPRLEELLQKKKNPLFAQMTRHWDNAPDLLKTLCEALVDEPPLSYRDGGVIKAGFLPHLDELRTAARDGKQFIVSLEAAERRRTGIQSLKVRFNRVFGYYIEVTKANLPLVPADYIRKQTLANAERFITGELKAYEDKVLGAEEKIKQIEVEAFIDLRGKIAAASDRIQKAADEIASLDVILSLAEVAEENRYCRPVIDESHSIEIKGGRHPVIETLNPQNRFIPNDVFLNADSERLLMITGPNMAGKSTLMRQVALIVLMAQMGSFVPADSARIGQVDKLFTRVGAQDRLAKGASTFMVEMTETAHILNSATPKSLILFDEIGRGTSTFDGVSIAWAVAEYLHDTIQARTLFATHYHELTDLALTKPGIKNYNIAITLKDDEIIFLRKLVPGGAERSYGIHVAQLAGLPSEVIERSKEILKNLEQGEFVEGGTPRIARKTSLNSKQQLGLFPKT